MDIFSKVIKNNSRELTLSVSISGMLSWDPVMEVFKLRLDGSITVSPVFSTASLFSVACISSSYRSYEKRHAGQILVMIMKIVLNFLKFLKVEYF